MNKSSHEIKKKEILNSAFRIWGKDHFRFCSLSKLAASHNITKQALYCYFPSKEKLEMAMEEEAAAIYLSYTENLLRQLKKTSGADFAAVYMNESRNFIRKNIFTFDYISHRFRQDTIPELFQDSLWKLYRLAEEKAAIPPTGIRYLNAMLINSIHCGSETDSSRWEKAWQEGFASKEINRIPEFDKILADAGRTDMGRFKDPLLNAVFDTVMEEAGGEVSLGKVARRAGLSKSSLYNYWPSKQAMFDDVLGQQAAIYGNLFSDLLKNYSHPADRLFAYPAFIGMFFLRSPNVLNYIQRMTALAGTPLQNDSPAVPVFMAPLNDLLTNGSIFPRGCTPEEILILISMTAILEIQYHLTVNSVRIRIEQGLKDTYRLISGGIQALRRTM